MIHSSNANISHITRLESVAFKLARRSPVNNGATCSVRPKENTNFPKDSDHKVSITIWHRFVRKSRVINMIRKNL